MLILEIAAGIVLAVLVLAFWPYILAGVAVLVGIAILLMLAGGINDSQRAAPTVTPIYRQATAKERACFFKNKQYEVTSVDGSPLSPAEQARVLLAYQQQNPLSANQLNPECLLDGPAVPISAMTPGASRWFSDLAGFALVVLVALAGLIPPFAPRIAYRMGWVFQRLK